MIPPPTATPAVAVPFLGSRPPALPLQQRQQRRHVVALRRRPQPCTDWEEGSVAVPLCTIYLAHPLHARFANIFGTYISEATVRSNPNWEVAI